MGMLASLRWAFMGNLGKALLFLMAKTARVRVSGGEAYRALRRDGKPVILLIWHGRIFFPIYYFRKRGIMPLVSPSRDGEILTQIIDRWGYKVSRGSSSHAIVRAWLEMKRELGAGGEVIIVPDGPRGPARVLKLGGLKLAQQTGAPLVPFTFSASKTKVFASWDRFLVFKPFARVLALFGDAIAVDPALEGEALEAERKRIEGILVALDEKADAAFAPAP